MLLDHATRIANESKLVFEMMQQFKQPSAPEPGPAEINRGLAITIGSELSEFLLGAAFAGLRDALPHEVTLAVLPGARIEEQVASGGIDIGVICGTATHADLDATDIAEEAMMLVFGPALLAAADAITPRMPALAGLDLLLPNWEHSSRRFVEQHALRAGVKLRPVAEIGDFTALKILLRQGVGYAILPHCTVKDEVARGTLCAFKLQGSAGRIGISVISRRATADHHAIRAARRELATCLGRAAATSRSNSLRLLATEAAMSPGD